LSPQTTLPELRDPQNHAKTSRRPLPDPKNAPENPKAAEPIFKTESPEPHQTKPQQTRL
jgi:hypothetical protein